VDAAALRAEFPVTRTVAYLNAGTCGPLPRAAVAAMCEEIERAAVEGRAKDHFERLQATQSRLRAAYGGVIGAEPEDVALTGATSDGMVRVLLGLDLAPGDEVVTAELEHPGLLGPLTAVRDRLGIAVSEVPLSRVADAVSRRTRLVACSHVSWTTGELAPDLSGLDIPVLLDGAQGAGAIPVDVEALGCAFYAAAGQKWLCGPVGTGLLYVSPAWRDRVRIAGPTYVNLSDPGRGLGARPWADARAHDSAALSLEASAAALAAHDTLAAFGWPAVHERARGLAATLAERLAAAGREVAPRGSTTLVSWVSEDPECEVQRCREAGVVVRGFPNLPWVRAAVGAWNDEADLEALLDVVGR
jgi:selenocysteine lyase/cysteine desulfurase